MQKQISRFFLLSALLFSTFWVAKAQIAARAVLYNTNTESFPQITSYLNAFDGAGNFIHGLGVQNVKIIEDGQSLSIDEIIEMNPGSQYVVAINMGPAYAIQDVNGISRFEHIRTALQSWIETYPQTTADNLSLVSNDELEGLHFDDPAEWLSLFQSFQPNFDTALPSLDVLSQAIITASNPTAQAGTGRGILLITPLPSAASLAALPSLESLAKQNQVRINIWMVSSRAYFDSPGAIQLENIALQSGGHFFRYSGEESLPAVHQYVDPLRYTYSLTYTSKISSGDNHQIAANVNTSALTTISEAIEFSLSVQPPNPILVSPPIEIIRSEQVSDEPSTDEPTYRPNVHQIEILTEFPDEYQRQLQKSSLLVDGEVVDENSSPPFDRFNWDLSTILEDSTHFIQVEVVDNLGLRGATLEHQVKITIAEAPFNFANLLKQNLLLIIGISTAVGLSLLIMALIIQGKIQPGVTGRLSKKKQNTDNQDEKLKESKPSIIDSQEIQERKNSWINRFSWPKRQAQISIPEEAFLEFLVHNNGNQETNRVPITQRELTFGNDPTLATIDLNDPSLEALHARIIKDEDGTFRIVDEGSIAGTWVNYSPVTSQTVTLRHGDTIHLGRIQFKFKYADAGKIPNPKVFNQEQL
jgi:hypothetical protein